MKRLTDVNIGSLKQAVTRRTRTAPPAAPLPQQPVQAPSPETLNEIQWLQRIPEQTLKPFWQVDLIPDLIYLLQSEGVQATIEETYPIPQPPSGQTEISQPAPPDPQVVANQQRRRTVQTAFRSGGVKRAVLEILFPDRDPSSEELAASESAQANLTEAIYSRGIQRLTLLMRATNPLDPASLIFQHPSQDVHRATQQVQIELIKNEPDIEERSTIQCACGSGKIKTTMVQTRRADEPPTIFAQCAVCKSKWKLSAA